MLHLIIAMSQKTIYRKEGGNITYEDNINRGGCQLFIENRKYICVRVHVMYPLNKKDQT